MSVHTISARGAEVKSNSTPSANGALPKPTFTYREGWQDRIPSRLRDGNRWVLWRYELRGDKWTKVPYRSALPSVKASTKKPATWSTFDEAVAAYERLLGTEEAVDGIGRVFEKEDGLVGMDLDKCFIDGVLAPWAKAYLDKLLPTYHEISPSGKGYKLWMIGKLDGPGTKVGDVELYDDGRFFTVTGDGYREVADRSEEIEQIYRDLKPVKTNGHVSAPSGTPLASDEELLAKARSSQFGEEFCALFEKGWLQEGSPSEWDYSLCKHLAYWFNRDPIAIDRVFRFSKLYRDKWDEPRGDSTYGAITIAKASAAISKVYTRDPLNGFGEPGCFEPERNGHAEEPADASAETGDDRIDINFTPDLHVTVDQSAAVLASDPDLYWRATSMACVTRVEEATKKGIRRAAGAPVIAQLGATAIRTILSRRARFWELNRNGKWVRRTPRKEVAEAVDALTKIPGSRELVGVIEAPTLRADGSLLSVPGYDESTGLLYLPNAEFPAIPEEPSLEEGRAAAKLLLDLVCDFPFRADSDRAAWLSNVVTLVARSAVGGAVPGFLYIANVAASGKSFLANLAALIAYGRAATFDSYATQDEEMEKKLGAVAMSGDPFLLLDNVANGQAIGGPALDKAITCDGVYRARILGKSQMTPHVPWRTVIAATGNNISTKADAVRRFVPCFLLSPMEHPEERDPSTFKIPDLKAHVLKERPRLVAAALTLVLSRSEPVKLTAMDFPEWDKVVRQAVYRTVGVDPAGGRLELRSGDETSSERHNVVLGLAALLRRLGKDSITAAAAAAALNEKDSKEREYFSRAIDRETGFVTGNSLGYVLKRNKDATTPYGALSCKESNAHEKARLWFVVGSQ